MRERVPTCTGISSLEPEARTCSQIGLAAPWNLNRPQGPEGGRAARSLLSGWVSSSSRELSRVGYRGAAAGDQHRRLPVQQLRWHHCVPNAYQMNAVLRASPMSAAYGSCMRTRPRHGSLPSITSFIRSLLAPASGCRAAGQVSSRARAVVVLSSIWQWVCAREWGRDFL